MRLVIIGGGIVGTAIAARLGPTDHNVVLFERGEIGAETTAASAGLLMRSAIEPEPFDLRVRDRAHEAYRDLFNEQDLEAPRRGILRVAETPAFAERLERSAAMLSEHEVEASFLEPDELFEYGIEPDGFAGALHTADDRVCDPAAVARVFAERALDAGVDVQTGIAVRDVDTRNGRVIAVGTDDGRLDVDCVVNAAGPWAPELNDSVGVSLSLRHTRGPMLALECPEPPTGPTVVFESKRYVRPTETGAWIGAYRTDYTEGARHDLRDRALTPAFRDSAKALEAVVPALEGATAVDEWVGFRTVTPDGRPIVGETDLGGYLVACGLTGQGITLAPAVAEVVGDLLEGAIDLDHRTRLSPARFGSSSTGRA